MATHLEQLVYDLSLGSLNQQEAELNEVRARTGILLAATAIAISLLGGRAIEDGERTVFDLAGLALGAASFLLSVYVLVPKGEFAGRPVVGRSGATVSFDVSTGKDTASIPPEPPPGLYAPEPGGRTPEPPERPADIPRIPPGMYAPETGLIRKVPKSA